MYFFPCLLGRFEARQANPPRTTVETTAVLGHGLFGGVATRMTNLSKENRGPYRSVVAPCGICALPL